MERWQRVRRAVALISAVVLIAAFVLYRAGFGAFSMSSSKSTFIFIEKGVTPPDTAKPTEKAPEAPAEKPTPDPNAPAKPGE